MIFWAGLLSLLLAESPCTQGSRKAEDFPALEQKVQEILTRGSHLYPIAREADGVLAKLLQTQSPVLSSWLQERGLETATEQEKANQWRLYYLNNFILAKYPTPNPKVNESVEGIFQEIKGLVFPKGFQKDTERLFQEAKQQLVSYLEGRDFEPAVKQRLVASVGKIKLYWFEKLKGERYQNRPLEFLEWAASFDPAQSEINLGIKVRQFPNKETLAAAMIHEMAHAIDPCRLSGKEELHPFHKVLTCLRSSQSIAAKKRDDSQLQDMVQKGFITEALAGELAAKPTCNRAFYPPSHQQADQINEAFADWVSAEVIAQTSWAPLGWRSDLCAEDSTPPNHSRPNHLTRLQAIYFVQPKLQAILKVKSPAKYCSL